MDYQLVLQIATRSEAEAERLAALEDDLIEQLEDSADLDGHETDGPLANFFIATTDPEETFERLYPLLEHKQLLDTLVVAFRHVDEDDYTILWPEDEKERPFKAPE